MICTPVKKSSRSTDFRHIWWARNVIKSYKQNKQTFIWYGWHGKGEEEQWKNIWDSLKLNFPFLFVPTLFLYRIRTENVFIELKLLYHSSHVVCLFLHGREESKDAMKMFSWNFHENSPPFILGIELIFPLKLYQARWHLFIFKEQIYTFILMVFVASFPSTLSFVLFQLWDFSCTWVYFFFFLMDTRYSTPSTILALSKQILHLWVFPVLLCTMNRKEIEFFFTLFVHRFEVSLSVLLQSTKAFYNNWTFLFPQRKRTSKWFQTFIPPFSLTEISASLNLSSSFIF